MEKAIRWLLEFPCQQRAWLGEKVAGGVTDLLTKAFASDTKRAEEVGLQDSFLRCFPTEKYHGLPSISFLFATQREGEASVPAPPSPASSTRTGRTTQIHDLAFEKPCFSLPRQCMPGECPLPATKARITESLSKEEQQQQPGSLQQRGPLRNGKAVLGFGSQYFFFLEIHFATKLLAKSGGRRS